MYSKVTYFGNGLNTEFAIPFPYLRADTIQVRVNNILKTFGEDYTVDVSLGKVVLAEAPPPTIPVQLKRVTPRETHERIVVFTDPSDIRADVLNSADLQLLYIIQEALDDIAGGVGVGVPIGDPDPGAPLPPNVENALAGLNTEFTAALLAETNARAAALLAEATARSGEILGEAANRAAAIAAEATTRQSATDSLASQITALNAVVTDPVTGLAVTRSRLITEETTRATADSAAASRLSALESTVNAPSGGVANLAARLSTVEGTLTGGTTPEALAFRVTTLEASLETTGEDIDLLTARVATEEAARASNDTALGVRMDTVEASVDTLSASVTSEASARATADGQLASEYVLSVVTNAGGQRRITGFRITNLGGAGGFTDFVVQADRFAIANTSGEGAAYPFVIVGGVVYIDDAHIRQLAVDKLTGGTITGKTFILGTSGGGALSVFRSANYVAGSAGFALRSDGSFEASNGVFRGSVSASTITGSSINGGSITIDDSGAARFAYCTFQTEGANVGLELGLFRTGNNSVWVDFHSAQSEYPDYAARIIREPGVAGNFTFLNEGSGSMVFYNASGSGDYRFIDNNNQRLRFGSFVAGSSSIAGYIIVKTDDGVERKLAVLN